MRNKLSVVFFHCGFFHCKASLIHLVFFLVCFALYLCYLFGVLNCDPFCQWIWFWIFILLSSDFNLFLFGLRRGYKVNIVISDQFLLLQEQVSILWSDLIAGGYFAGGYFAGGSVKGNKNSS